MEDEINFTRTFVAIDMPDNIIKEVAKLQEILSKKNFAGKMVELENIHLTLKFIGEVEGRKLDEIRAELRKISFSKFEAKLGRAGVFGRGGMPRYVWVKIEGEGIWELQKKIDAAVVKAGIAGESKFTPHITIARVKSVSDKKEFADYVGNMGVKQEKMEITEFKLKKSELKIIGPEYSDLEIFKSS